MQFVCFYSTRLYKKTKFVARNKHIELREAFYENQYFDPQTVSKPYKKGSIIEKLSKLKKNNSKEISSQEHTGIYIKKPHEALDDVVVSSDGLSMYASSTEYIWKKSQDSIPVNTVLWQPSLLMILTHIHFQLE